MTNKKINEIMHEKINETIIYNQVLLQAEKKKQILRKRNLLLSTCGLLICIGIGWQMNQKSAPTTQGEDRTIVVNKKNTATDKKIDGMRLNVKAEIMGDMSIKSEAMEHINVDFFQHVTLPNDFSHEKELFAIYGQTEKGGEYDHFLQYEAEWSSLDHEKWIHLAFSQDQQPIRDYMYANEAEVSVIHGINVVIFEYESSYQATFYAKNLYFDLETDQVTLNEVIDFIASLIKE